MALTTKKKVATGVAAAVAAGLLAVGGASLADAATSTSSSSSSTEDSGSRGGTHTPVTGDEAAGVGAAVTAQDSTVTVTEVEQDEDGSYDVDGTRAGAEVRFDVSADLAMVTERTGGGHGGGDGGGSSDTPVTGDEATGVGAAVTATDAAVVVTGVEKDPDGSYDVEGTRAGAEVRFDVSADLATVTERTGDGHRGGHDGADDGATDGADDTTGSATAESSSATA